MNVVDLLIEQSSIRERGRTIDDVLGILNEEVMMYNNFVCDEINDAEARLQALGIVAGFSYAIKKRVEELKGVSK